MNELYDEILTMLEDEQEGVVATVVRTRGSTPREVGARMVVAVDGTIVGTIGGGCGEAEVWSEAMEIMGSSHTKLVEVDLLHDHDLEGGRACGGIMTVFLEPFGAEGVVDAVPRV